MHESHGQPVDKNGRLVSAGQKVRVLALSGDWFDNLTVEERSDVESMVGEVFAVDEVDKHGHPWVSKAWPTEAGRAYRHHFIALQPQEMELVTDSEEAVQLKPGR